MFVLFFGILIVMPAFFELVDISLRETVFLLFVTLLTPAILGGMEQIINWMGTAAGKIRTKFSRDRKRRTVSGQN